MLREQVLGIYAYLSDSTDASDRSNVRQSADDHTIVLVACVLVRLIDIIDDTSFLYADTPR